MLFYSIRVSWHIVIQLIENIFRFVNLTVLNVVVLFREMCRMRKEILTHKLEIHNEIILINTHNKCKLNLAKIRINFITCRFCSSLCLLKTRDFFKTRDTRLETRDPRPATIRGTPQNWSFYDFKICCFPLSWKYRFLQNNNKLV